MQRSFDGGSSAASVAAGAPVALLSAGADCANTLSATNNEARTVVLSNEV
jgi:hypothetical protein